MTLFLVLIFVRVFNIQYVQGEKYRKLSKERTVRNDTIFANRGNVYADDGNLLATSLSPLDQTINNLSLDILHTFYIII